MSFGPVLVVGFLAPFISAELKLFNASSTVKGSSNTVQTLGESHCQPLPGLKPPLLAPQGCEHLMDDFLEDYEDFGVMKWGAGAVPSRRFPFAIENRDCKIEIRSVIDDKDAYDEFSVPDLMHPLYDVFLDCLLQHIPPPMKSFWVGGYVEFTGLGMYALELVMTMKKGVYLGNGNATANAVETS